MAREIADQRECRAAAQPLVWRGRNWYVRTRELSSGELIICSLRVLREIELLRNMQRRFGLTDRQADVLRYLLRGRTTREIADTLDLATRTVRMHEEGLRRSMHVGNNYEVLCVADQLRREQ